MINDLELKNKLFDFVFNLLLSHGGDGDVVIQGSEWEENANLFETWIKENHNSFLARNNNDNYVTFHNDQECIYFADVSFDPPPWADLIKTDRI